MLVPRQRGSTELARWQSRSDLGITSNTLGCQLGAPSVLDPVSKIDLLDLLEQLLVRVSGVLEQRPHSVDDEYQPIDALVEVEKILHT